MHELVHSDPEQATPHDRDPALDAAHGRITLLESQLHRAEEENIAFMQSLRHVAAAAEELLTEARVEADEMKAAVQAEADAMRNEVAQSLESSLAVAQREADDLLNEARTQAFEMVAVARADAREATMIEQGRVAEEAEMLTAMRERIEAERHALAAMHTQLSSRLRTLVTAMLEFADRGAEIDLGDPELFASAALAATTAAPAPEARPVSDLAQVPLTGPDLTGHVDDGELTVPPPPALPSANRMTSAAGMPLDGSMADHDRAPRSDTDMHTDDEHLDRAFNAFFAADDDSSEPARRWILEE